VLLLEIKQEFEGVRSDEHLSSELILPALSRNEDRTIKISPDYYQQFYTRLNYSIINWIYIHPYTLAYNWHQIFHQKNSCFEIFASISETKQNTGFYFLRVSILIDDVCTELKNFWLKQNFRYS